MSFKDLKIRPLLIVGGAVVGVLVIISAGICALASSPPSVSGGIAFVSTRDGGSSVTFIESFGANATKLIGPLNSVIAMQFSPNRQTIALLGGDAQNTTLYMVKLDSEDPEIQILPTDDAPLDIVWNPTGSTIAYSFKRAGGGYGISFVDIASEQRTIFTTLDGKPSLGNWSPNLEWFTYSIADSGPDAGIYIKNPTGVNTIRLTETVGLNPVWSPDGSKIAFRSLQENGQGQIYTMKEDGSKLTSVTSESGDNWDFEWSPSSNNLVFVSDRSGNPELFIANPDGKNVEQLTFNDAIESDPTWSPSGLEILFSSDAGGDPDLYAMRSDGSNQRRITRSTAIENSPIW